MTLFYKKYLQKTFHELIYLNKEIANEFISYPMSSKSYYSIFIINLLLWGKNKTLTTRKNFLLAAP